MPVMNGVEATQILRQHGVLLPIIAVTGKSVSFPLPNCKGIASPPASGNCTALRLMSVFDDSALPFPCLCVFSFSSVPSLRM
jgi:hypothetical protein